MRDLAVTERELADLAGISYETLYRLRDGKPQRSKLAADKIRAVLAERNIKTEAVPSESDGDWVEPENRPQERRALSNEANVFRRNLVLFREQAGYVDLHAAAAATGISVETLRAYELGEEAVSGRHLIELVRAYGHPAEHFDMSAPPPPLRKPAPAVHARVVGDLDEMLPAHKDRIRAIERELAEINAAERQRLESQRPKRR